jgi:hypothetical protein
MAMPNDIGVIDLMMAIPTTIPQITTTLSSRS